MPAASFPAPEQPYQDLAQALTVFAALPTATKELALLLDATEKTTGPENVQVNKMVRKKSVAGVPLPRKRERRRLR